MPVDITTPLRIGSVDTRNRLFLAPVDGAFDQSYRRICVAHGVGLTCSEMIASQGVKFNRGKLLPKIERGPEEIPYQVQLSGHRPDMLAEIARQLQDLGYADILDMNMGCPSRLVTKSGNGAALMKDPEQIRQIVAAVRKAIDIPLSVKMRSGWDEQSKNVLEVARIVEGEGADMVTVHPRTRSQAFGGKSDWDWIAKVKAALSIPVVGNGDVKSAADAQQMLAQTGCDAVMIARGAFGYPWLIDKILANDDSLSPTPEDVAATLLLHIAMQCERMPEKNAIRFMRSHVNWYIKGLPGASEFRREAMRIPDRATLESAIRGFFEKAATKGAVPSSPSGMPRV